MTVSSNEVQLLSTHLFWSLTDVEKKRILPKVFKQEEREVAMSNCGPNQNVRRRRENGVGLEGGALL